MKERSVFLSVAAFNGVDSAEAALTQLKRPDRAILSAVVLQKDADETVSFVDVGLTPRKGTTAGVVLGGVVGLVAGGPVLALGALGGLVGRRSTKGRQATQLVPEQLGQLAGSLGPSCSAIIAVSKRPLSPKVEAKLVDMGADLFEVAVQPEVLDQLDDNADEDYRILLESVAEKTGGQAKSSLPYPRIHVVVNPASGKNQPILNTLNSVFGHRGVAWHVSVTHKYGDATEFARRAAESGKFDLVAGYGGDGTQHEIANGLMGTGVPMGVLPGGTGNGFANEMGIPGTLEPALELLCTSHNRRKVDIAQLDDAYFVQRLFTGIEPEEQTSREDKDKYGTLAYLKRDVNRMRDIQDIPYRLTIDGQEIKVMGYKCYVVNSAKAGTGLSISNQFSVDDSYLDVFMLSRDPRSTEEAIQRFLNIKPGESGLYYWRGQQIDIQTEPDQPVWTDGEYTGRTPVSIQVLPKALTIAVP